MLTLSMLERMGEKQTSLLKNALVALNRGGRGIRIGTVCSGTDLIIPCARQMLARLYQHCGLDQPKMIHAFAVESNPAKQTFILKNHNPIRLFADLFEMSGSTAWDVKSGAVQHIPEVDIVFAGFSCKTFSTLSAKRNADCLRSRAGSSGSTYGGVVDYITKHIPKMVLLENVLSMLRGKWAKKNLDELGRMGKDRGYIVAWSKMNASEGGLPQNRPRVYVCLHKTHHREKLSDNLAGPCSMLLQDLLVPKEHAYTVDDIMLPEESAEFLFWKAKILARSKIGRLRPRKRKRKSSGLVPLWQWNHAQVFRQLGYAWPPTDKTMPSNVFTDILSARSKEALIFDEAGTRMCAHHTLQPNMKITPLRILKPSKHVQFCTVQ